MKLINIGYGNLVSAERVITVTAPDSLPIKRLIMMARDDNREIDCTSGRRTTAVIVTDSGHVILSALTTETIGNRLNGSESGEDIHDTDDK